MDDVEKASASPAASSPMAGPSDPSSNAVSSSTTPSSADNKDPVASKQHDLSNINSASSNSASKAQDTSPLTPTRSQRFRSEARRITLHFTPSWFSVNMGTGITSILLHQLPYRFRGLTTISNILFAFNLLLFILFLGISVARYTIWPQLFPIMLFHPVQSLFCGTFAMGYATLISMCALSAAPSWGPGFATFTWVLWWTNVVLSLAICVGMPFIQFTRHVQSLDKITGVWFLPVVTTVVCASTGGLVADILPPAHAKLTIIVCYVIWGTGFGMAFLLMSLYYARQAIYKIPPAQLIVSTFLPIGPCGQGAFGLLQLASVLYKLSRTDGVALPSPNATDPDSARIMALAVYAVSVPISLVIWGLGIVWVILATSSILDLWQVSKLKFNLGWHGFVFPLGTMASAAIKFGSVLDSGAFKVIGTALTLVVLLLWVFVTSMTVAKAMKGEIFFSPCLAEMCDDKGEPPKFVPTARKYSYEPRPEVEDDEVSRSKTRADGKSLSRARK